ncbi:enoyl-CoA hydratase/isomerase family protein [Embleya sp. NPDC050154]|uniref:enoyl-CoA hydratase/isomerase family protein n=1 Tax=unclassified Embleya TaxID=2699296 RepID=UPI0037AE1BEC
MTSTTEQETVLTRRQAGLGRIVLNRPRALNALTHAMVRGIDAALTAWEHDEDVRLVVITGAGERGLCAGGDIRAIHADAVGGGTGSLDFWRDEYRLNAHIARYPKTYVAVMDGIVMGGGVGVSAHGGLRIVTERSTIAMPETGIGFVPDVGGTHLLARAPGECGTHLALTGSAIGPGDAIACGLADHFIPSHRLDAALEALAGRDSGEVVARFAEPAPGGELVERRGWIDACYASDSVEEILERLEADGEQAAKQAAEHIRAKSPTALKVTLASLRRARELASLEAVLDQEYRVSTVALGTPDLAEGIRAQVIDKDRAPRWSPDTLEAVRPEQVAAFFEPLGARELGLAISPSTEEACR